MTATPSGKKIELWPLARLVPYERNARTHSAEQVAQIAASIQEFGFTNPILVDSDDGILAGHGRLAAAKDLGLTQVPVIVLDHLSAAQRRAYVIADNQLALNAGWDIDILASEIDCLRKFDFNLDLLGFSDTELESMAVGGWDEDVEELKGQHGEHTDALKHRIVVELDGTYRDEVAEAIRMYCDGHAISVEIK